MKGVVLAVVTLLAVAFVASAFKPRFDVVHNHVELFEQYTRHYKKSYTTEEKPRRYNNFLASLARIAQKNKDAANATYALNKFSDMSTREFRNTYLMPKFSADKTKQRELVPQGPITVAPQVYDWRTKGKVTAVKNQEQCGSCWAFSATENIESVYMIKNNLSPQQMQPLSPQQIVDCDTTDQGCNGGDTTTAYQYVIQAGGLETDSAYPYTGEDGTCNFNAGSVLVKISSWKYATSNDNEAVMQNNLVNWSPLSICVDASSWQDYSSGVVMGSDCGDQLDHCVQAVGYNMNGPTPYWIVRNSWGTDWGNNGYIWLQYGQNTCGCADEATTAVI